MRFSFLCFYYRDKLKQQLGVRACSTRLRAANYTASICGLPLAETNFRTAISTIISYIQTHTHTPSTHTATQRNKEAHTEKKKLQIVSCLRPPHHYTTVHHTGEVWMVVVFKTHENRQIVVHTRGIQRRGVFYHELRVKGLNCVESRGSFSQVRTPVGSPLCACPVNGGGCAQKRQLLYARQNIKVSGEDRLCLKTTILLRRQWWPLIMVQGGAKWEERQLFFFGKKSPSLWEQLGLQQLCCVCVFVCILLGYVCVFFKWIDVFRQCVQVRVRFCLVSS